MSQVLHEHPSPTPRHLPQLHDASYLAAMGAALYSLCPEGLRISSFPDPHDWRARGLLCLFTDEGTEALPMEEIYPRSHTHKWGCE